MEQEADPLRPFSVLTRLAVDLSGKCSDTAFQIIEKLCLDRDAMTAFGPRFRPFMEPEHAYVEGEHTYGIYAHSLVLHVLRTD